MEQNAALYKKKKAFTLAELLITLTIIGIIASTTIPAIIQSTQDAQLRVDFKKKFSIISQVANRHMLENGGTLKGYYQNCTDFVNKFSLYIPKIRSADNNWDQGICWNKDNEFYFLNGTPSTQKAGICTLLFDGTFFKFNLADGECTSYGIKECGSIEIDVNGFNGPNTWGKDIYGVSITGDGARPLGVSGTSNCTPTDSGRNCAALYLRQ